MSAYLMHIWLLLLVMPNKAENQFLPIIGPLTKQQWHKLFHGAKSIDKKVIDEPKSFSLQEKGLPATCMPSFGRLINYNAFGQKSTVQYDPCTLMQQQRKCKPHQMYDPTPNYEKCRDLICSPNAAEEQHCVKYSDANKEKRDDDINYVACVTAIVELSMTYFNFVLRNRTRTKTQQERSLTDFFNITADHLTLDIFAGQFESYDFNTNNTNPMNPCGQQQRMKIDDIKWVYEAGINHTDQFPLSAMIIYRFENGSNADQFLTNMTAALQKEIKNGGSLEMGPKYNQSDPSFINLYNFTWSAFQLKPTDDQWCPDGQKILHFNNEITVINEQINGTTERIVRSLPLKWEFRLPDYQLYMVIVNENVTESDSPSLFQSAVICYVPSTLQDANCRRTRYNESEFERLPNRSVLVNGDVVPFGQYEIMEASDGYDRLDVCYKALPPAEKFCGLSAETGDGFARAETVLTVILSVLSLVSLIVVFITYWVFPNFHNLPGRCMLNLTVSLFLSLMLFFTASLDGMASVTALCTTTAVALHYFLLSSFAWMTIMAYDIHKTFGPDMLATRHRTATATQYSRRLKVYCLIGWGVPFVVVGCALMIDLLKLPHFRIAYGSAASTVKVSVTTDVPLVNVSQANSTKSVRRTFEKTSDLVEVGCWIKEPLAGMMLFGGPMLLSLVVKVCYFVLTVLSVRKVASDKTLRARSGSTVVRQRLSSSDSDISQRGCSVGDESVQPACPPNSPGAFEPGASRARSRALSKRAASGFSRKKEGLIYFRIIGLLGLLWIFAVVAPVFDPFLSSSTPVLCYVFLILKLFTVLNCSQGFIMFLVLVCNRRVLNLYKQLFKGKLSKGKGAINGKIFTLPSSASLTTISTRRGSTVSINANGTSYMAPKDE